MSKLRLSHLSNVTPRTLKGPGKRIYACSRRECEMCVMRYAPVALCGAGFGSRKGYASWIKSKAILPSSIVAKPIVWLGCRRRSVGEPGLKI